MPNHVHNPGDFPADVPPPLFRQEVRVLAVLAVFVVVLEIVARVMAPGLDYDRKHIHALPTLVKGLTERARQSGSPRVVFLGNSLMMHGVDESILRDELVRINNPAVEIAKITPVGTAMIDWVYLSRRCFESTGSQPDVIVLGFVAHHLHDQEPIKLRRLARHFVTPGDLPDLWRSETMDFHSVAQSMLCNASALAGDQPEHQLKCLQAVIPDYQTGLNQNNDWVRAAADHGTGETSTRADAESYRRLERFLRDCRSRGVRVWLVPMPQPVRWEPNPAARRLAEAAGAHWLDAQQIPGLTAEDFSDGYHLGPTGAAKFTRWMASQVRAMVP